MGAAPGVPEARFKERQRRRILFATNRNQTDEPGGPGAFGDELADGLTYGAAMVNIPLKHHVEGELELESWWNWRRNPDRVFFILEHGVSRIPNASSFYDRFTDRDALVMIHGYNNSFEEAILTTAQFHHDIRFPGIPVSFTWPSAGAMVSYAQDGRMAAASVPHLVEFLQNLIETNRRETGGKVHLVAHSMGNRVLLEALLRMDQRDEFASPAFGTVTLAAPDVDINIFASQVPSAVKAAEILAFYYSTKDWVLDRSDDINAMQRAGLYPVFFEGMETINVDEANTDSSTAERHRYYAGSPEVLFDLRLLTQFLRPASLRSPPLQRDSTSSIGNLFEHWVFEPF